MPGGIGLASDDGPADRFASPFGGGPSAQDRKIFAELKPICVRLLSATRSTAVVASAETARDLCSLREVLARFITVPPLAPLGQDGTITEKGADRPLSESVLSYVFFPISHLFQATPKGPLGLPDRTRQEAFACLELLSSQWWRRWITISGPSQTQKNAGTMSEALQMWRQLLILGAVSLGGSPGPQTNSEPETASKNSLETSEAILSFLHCLLAPRKILHAHTNASQARTATQQQWEWDGESDLPSLDDLDSPTDIPASTRHAQSEETVYPNGSHLKAATLPAIKSPLLHALTSSIDVLVDCPVHSSTISLRCKALSVAQIISAHWVAQSTTTDIQEVAQRLRPIVPGVTSKVIRLLTQTTAKAAVLQSRSAITELPGEIVARAMDLLRIVVVPPMADAVTQPCRSTNTLKMSGLAATDTVHTGHTGLESLVQGVDRIELTAAGTSGPGVRNQSQADMDQPQKLDSQGAQLAAMLKNISAAIALLDRQQRAGSAPATTSMNRGVAQHPNIAAQKAVVRFASAMLNRCAATLKWMATLDSDRSNEVASHDVVDTALRWLLDLASSGSKEVRTAAKESLEGVTTQHNESRYLISKLATEASNCLDNLPDAARGHRSDDVHQVASRMTALLRIAPGIVSSEQGVHVSRFALDVLAGRGVDRWGSKLVACLSISNLDVSVSDILSSHPRLVSFAGLEKHASAALSTMLEAWGRSAALFHMTRLRAKLGTRSSKGGTGTSEAINAKTDDIFAMARWALQSCMQERKLFSLHAALNEEATALFARCTNHLWIATELFRGLATEMDDAKLGIQVGSFGRRARRQAHKLAEEISAAVVEMMEHESQLTWRHHPRDDEPDQPKHVAQAEDGPQSEVEHIRGLPQAATVNDVATTTRNFGPALNLSFVQAGTLTHDQRSQSDRKHRLEAALLQLQHQRALQLDLLASASRLLGPSFRDQLLQTLYPMLSALAQSSPVVVQAAQRALVDIAHSAGYGDLVGLVRENVDYILGEASWRLVVGLGRELDRQIDEDSWGDEASSSAARMSSNAHALVLADPSQKQLARPLLSAMTPPAVLTQVMRLLGPSSLHLVEDSIDEVLDALDRHHEHEGIADALLGVMDQLLDVMREEAQAATSTCEDTGSADNSTSASVARKRSVLPDGSGGDLDDLSAWLLKRRTGPSADAPADDLAAAFDAVEKPVQGEASASPSHEESPTAPETPVTRSQRLLVGIMSKSLPFLSHSSAVIRARVLKLLGSGAQLLAPLTSESDANSEDAGLRSRKWTRREDELLPLVNRAWPLIVSRLGWPLTRPPPDARALARGPRLPQLSEEAPAVRLQAINLVETLAIHIPDFIGRRVVEDAWPRVRLVLHVDTAGARASKQNRQLETTRLRLETTDSSRPLRADNDIGINTPANSNRPAGRREDVFRALDSHADVGTYRIVLASLRALTPLLQRQGLAFPDAALWEILTYPLFVEALDARQSPELRQAAVVMVRASRSCDGGGTSWTLFRSLNSAGKTKEGTALPSYGGKSWDYVLPGIPRRPEGTSLLDVALSAAESFV